MTSILTNTAAMSSLQALTATQRQLSTTQSQISSGLSVAKASDNAAYWSIATTMRAQVAGLDAVNKGLSLTLAIADVTGAALGSIKTSLDRIQADVVAAQQSGVSLSAVQLDISAQQQSILAVANAASFNGVNWLTNKISTSETVNIKVVADPDEIDYAKIALGQEQGISTFDSTITQTFIQSESGVSTSETTTSGYHTTRTAAEDGTVTTDKEAKTPTDSGSFAILHVGDVIVPMSVTSSGSLTKSSFSLVPLTLFSDYIGTYSSHTEINYGGVEDLDASYDISPYSTTTHSYNGYGDGLSAGILDGIIYVTSHKTNASTSTTSSTTGAPTGSSQPQFTADLTGGETIPGQPSGSGSITSTGTAQTIQAIRESILTLDITDASAADLVAIGRMVQAAIGGITGASTAVGALQTQISTMQTYNSTLSDALTSGIGSLVDADMNVASTRLQALQTQQQLGLQALSMANQNGQSILKLFQAA